jgi:phosphate-selective porin OprO/OprP
MALAATAGTGIAAKAEAQAPRTTTEAVQFKINGRVHMDVVGVKADYTSGTDLEYGRSFMRRIFLGVEGRMTDNWRYNVKLDVSPGRSDTSGQGNEVALDDAFLEYAGGFGSLFIGNANAVSPLEDRTSSNEVPFIERSGIYQSFIPGRVLSLSWLTGGGNWSAGVALQGDSPSNAEATVGESFGVQGRLTFAPIYQRTPDGLTLVHLGLHGRDRENNGDGLLAYSARPAVSSNTGLATPVSAGAIGKHDTTIGGELALQYNAFGMTAEYMSTNVERLGRSDVTFDGYYVDLFWSPTGESRNYNATDGSFGRITPLRTLGSDGGIGHVMLSARYDYINLADATNVATGIFGGEQTGYVLGATWKPVGYVKFHLNYSDYTVDRLAFNRTAVASADGDIQAVSLRTQFDW